MINQEEFNNIFERELNRRERQVLLDFLAGKRDSEIQKKLEVTSCATVRKHLSKAARQFQINPNGFSYRDKLVEIFHKYKPDLICSNLLQKYCLLKSPSQLRYPEGPERADSSFYVRLIPTEDICFDEIKKPGALVRIRSPKEMGKTSLLNQIIDQAKKYNYYPVYLDVSQIETERLMRGPREFLRGFYAYAVEELQQANIPALKEWHKDTPIMLSCTSQFQTLLRKLDAVLVLVLDGVDKVFKHQEIYQDFFPMLRNWHERANTSETWEKLRLIVAYSTEDYGELDLNQSPFNVGLPIQLDELTKEQLNNLAFIYGVDKEVIPPLMSLVGGHPYLVRLALYHLARRDITIEQLLQYAPSGAIIYNQHLHRYLDILKQNKELEAVFKQIVCSPTPVKLERKTKQVYQLDSMGLIKQEYDQKQSCVVVKPRCNLYRLYFCDRLS
ncbi:MAG: hypothetical protein F6K58_13995 [Symploca sp. SIO2E9]|nr:hypothetical protein [Symploca sp. SIO2E9]